MRAADKRVFERGQKEPCRRNGEPPPHAFDRR
jgi:hypothetical protein